MDIPEGWVYQRGQVYQGVDTPGGTGILGVGMYAHPPGHGTWDTHPSSSLATATHTVGKWTASIPLEYSLVTYFIINK